MDNLYRCWAEIDLDNLKHNLHEVKKNLHSKTLVMAVVKADAYGHGAKTVAKALESARVDWFAVAELGEARVLREAGIKKPILVLGHIPVQQAAQAAALDVTYSIDSLERAKALDEAAAELGVRPMVHIKLDTGMGRYGFNAFDPKSAVEDIAEAYALRNLEVTGIYTHFATADALGDKGIEYVKKQHWFFYNIIRVLKDRKVNFRIIHCANSATAIRFPQLQYNLVRAGIALYGLSPTGAPIEGTDLKPVMSFKARIERIHEIKAGQSIGYGCTFTAEEPTKVAVVTAGYADGVPRVLSNRGLARTARGVAPIIGNICMDALMLDISRIEGLSEGDEVTFFGDGLITADNVASLAETISYEIICGISRRVPRIYLSGGNVQEVVDYTVNV